MLSELFSSNKKPESQLTRREYEIMSLIVSGKKLKDIASDLFISIKTVSTHRKNILKKLNLNNNIELTKYCLKHQLID